jgi:hypothetical protein
MRDNVGHFRVSNITKAKLRYVLGLSPFRNAVCVNSSYAVTVH